MSANISISMERLRSHFNSGLTKSLSYRKQQLHGLSCFLKECERDIETALYQDLKKSAIEAFATEINIVSSELKFTQKKLASWIKPKKVSTILATQPGTSRIYPEPLGVVLIIAPWNYPIQLTLSPLIGAIAAGNCAVLKPSEIAPATSHLLATRLPNYIDPNCLCIIEGGVKETQTLLAEKFDYIFYTGNNKIGRIVMSAAAKHLTPVTLELGGKSPCIVDQDTDLIKAARRIVWGKFMNAGQTCVAPDYVLVHESVEDELMRHMQTSLNNFFGNNPKNSSDYSRIINSHHYQRLANLISGNGEIVIGGQLDEKELYIAPTILRNVQKDAPIMAEEIFGPILPILKVKNMQEAIAFINARSKPLALYLFSNSTAMQGKIIQETSSGGVCINHVIFQLTVPQLPFGGVGESGMGMYHGKYSFKTFSHFKSVLTKPLWFDPALLYPPYPKLLRALLKHLT